MRPIISEFSYGYALTEELSRGVVAGLIAAPMFPSLYSEGQPGGGWDVRIPYPVKPLFLQFKLSHYMVRANAAERALLGSAYYRFYLRPLRVSDQHRLLLSLEGEGNAVFYASPRFFHPSALNDAYLSRNVVERSVFFPPSAIGELPDSDEHYVAFNDSSAYFCSTPRQISYDFRGATHLQKFSQIAATAGTKADKRFFLDLVDRMTHVISRTELLLPDYLASIREPDYREKLSAADAASIAVYIARAYFDTELLLVAQSHK